MELAALIISVLLGAALLVAVGLAAGTFVALALGLDRSSPRLENAPQILALLMGAAFHRLPKGPEAFVEVGELPREPRPI